MNVKESIQLILDNKKRMILFVGFCLLISCIYSIFIATPYYRSVAKVYPVRDDSSFNRSIADVNPILKNFGGGLNSSYKKIDFYIPDLVKSDMISEKILAEKFYISTSNEKITLIDFWGMSDLDPNKAFYKAKNKLKKLIDVSTDDMSSLITISIETEDPLLSSDIIHFAVNEIEKYIVNEKNNLYELKRLVTDTLKNEYGEELKSKQESLVQFLKQNLLKMENLDNQAEKENRKREIGFDEQAYSFLTRDYIQANIESKSQNAIHRLDVPNPRILSKDLKSQILNPEYILNDEKSSPKTMLIIALTFISSFFGHFYYLLIRRKFA